MLPLENFNSAAFELARRRR